MCRGEIEIPFVLPIGSYDPEYNQHSTEGRTLNNKIVDTVSSSSAGTMVTVSAAAAAAHGATSPRSFFGGGGGGANNQSVKIKVCKWHPTYNGEAFALKHSVSQ